MLTLEKEHHHQTVDTWIFMKMELQGVEQYKQLSNWTNTLEWEEDMKTWETPQREEHFLAKGTCDEIIPYENYKLQE